MLLNQDYDDIHYSFHVVDGVDIAFADDKKKGNISPTLSSSFMKKEYHLFVCV